MELLLEKKKKKEKMQLRWCVAHGNKMQIAGRTESRTLALAIRAHVRVSVKEPPTLF